MLGVTNSSGRSIDSLSSNDFVCIYRRTLGNTNGDTHWRWLQSDYVSYDSSTYTFTAKRAFTARMRIIAKGSRNAGGTDCSVTYTFKKNGTTLYTGSVNNACGNLPTDVYSLTFAKNDTFVMGGSQGTNVYLEEVGFALYI